jgi:hypothetical protein
MLTSEQTVKQELLQKIEILPGYKLQEVLDFVEFLLFKNKPTATLNSQQEILAELSHIREAIYQSYGVYQGDLVAEARAEREQQVGG